MCEVSVGATRISLIILFLVTFVNFLLLLKIVQGENYYRNGANRLIILGMTQSFQRNQRRKLKTGRNDKCPCGSGKKYKRCCLLNPKIVRSDQEYQDWGKDTLVKSELLKCRGIFVNLPQVVSKNGKTYLPVGNGIKTYTDKGRTFHDLLVNNLYHTLGVEWYQNEIDKDEDHWHYIVRCIKEYHGDTSRDELRVTAPQNGVAAILMTGRVSTLLSLAFDVWLLDYFGYLRHDWLDRLRDHNEYQGVRYEIAVASLFVRIGCRLIFYDNDRIEPDGNPPKRAEFIAYDPKTGNRVAVEAKSRHIHGVLHTDGEYKHKQAISGDISKLFNKALQKETDGLPLIVFLDVNSPTELHQNPEETQWIKNVMRSFDSREKPTPQKPDTQAAVFITNFPFHYQDGDISHNAQHLYIGSEYSKNPLKDGASDSLLQRLFIATYNYGYVPCDLGTSRSDWEELREQDGFTEDVFRALIKEITLPSIDDPNYEEGVLTSNRLVDMLVWDVKQKSGGVWSPAVANRSYIEFLGLWSMP